MALGIETGSSEARSLRREAKTRSQSLSTQSAKPWPGPSSWFHSLSGEQGVHFLKCASQLPPRKRPVGPHLPEAPVSARVHLCALSLTRVHTHTHFIIVPGSRGLNQEHSGLWVAYPLMKSPKM